MRPARRTCHRPRGKPPPPPPSPPPPPPPPPSAGGLPPPDGEVSTSPLELTSSLGRSEAWAATQRGRAAARRLAARLPARPRAAISAAACDLPEAPATDSATHILHRGCEHTTRFQEALYADRSGPQTAPRTFWSERIADRALAVLLARWPAAKRSAQKAWPSQTAVYCVTAPVDVVQLCLKQPVSEGRGRMGSGGHRAAGTAVGAASQNLGVCPYSPLLLITRPGFTPGLRPTSSCLLPALWGGPVLQAIWVGSGCSVGIALHGSGRASTQQRAPHLPTRSRRQRALAQSLEGRLLAGGGGCSS